MKFRVTVERNETRQHTFEVTANNLGEANNKARALAQHAGFTFHEQIGTPGYSVVHTNSVYLASSVPDPDSDHPGTPYVPHLR